MFCDFGTEDYLVFSTASQLTANFFSVIIYNGIK